MAESILNYSCGLLRAEGKTELSQVVRVMTLMRATSKTHSANVSPDMMLWSVEGNQM